MLSTINSLQVLTLIIFLAFSFRPKSMPSTFLLRVSALATLFATSTFATPLSLHPRVVAAISEWDYPGCYTEANNMRALTGNSYYDDLMTVEKCAAVCSGFKWFGVEYGRECYCGNVINTGSVVTQASECSFSCPGNAAENCGAGNRLDMYSSTVAPPNPASFSSLGCYTEGTNGRTLVEKGYSSDSMTIELCASPCEGYAYFGVEYYREVLTAFCDVLAVLIFRHLVLLWKLPCWGKYPGSQH